MRERVERFIMVSTIRESYTKIVGYRLLNKDNYEVLVIGYEELLNRLLTNDIEVENIELDLKVISNKNINKYSAFDVKTGKLVGYDIPVVVEIRDEEYIISDALGNIKTIDLDEALKIKKEFGFANNKLPGKDLKELIDKLSEEDSNTKVNSVKLSGIKISRLNSGRYEIFGNNKKIVDNCIILCRSEVNNNNTNMVHNKNIILYYDKYTKGLICNGVNIEDAGDNGVLKVIYIDTDDINKLEDLNNIENKEGIDFDDIACILVSKNRIIVGVYLGCKDMYSHRCTSFEIIHNWDVNTSIENALSRHYKICDKGLEKVREVEYKLGIGHLNKEVLNTYECSYEDLEYKKIKINNARCAIKEIYITDAKVVIDNKHLMFEGVIKLSHNSMYKEGKLYNNIQVVKLMNNSLGIIKKAYYLSTLPKIKINVDNKGNLCVNSNNDAKNYSIDSIGINVYAMSNGLIVDATTRLDIYKDNILKVDETDTEYIVYIADIEEVYKLVYDKRKLKEGVDKRCNNKLCLMEHKLDIVSKNTISNEGLLVLDKGKSNLVVLNDSIRGIDATKNNCVIYEFSEQDSYKLNLIRSYVYGVSSITNYINKLQVNTDKVKLKVKQNCRLFCEEVSIKKDNLKSIRNICKKYVVIGKLTIDSNIEEIDDVLVEKILKNNEIYEVNFRNKVNYNEIIKRYNIDIDGKDVYNDYKSKVYLKLKVGKDHRGFESIYVNNIYDDNNYNRDIILKNKLSNIVNEEDKLIKLISDINISKVVNFRQYVNLRLNVLQTGNRDEYELDFEVDNFKLKDKISIKDCKEKGEIVYKLDLANKVVEAKREE